MTLQAVSYVRDVHDDDMSEMQQATYLEQWATSHGIEVSDCFRESSALPEEDEDRAALIGVEKDLPPVLRSVLRYLSAHPGIALLVIDLRRISVPNRQGHEEFLLLLDRRSSALLVVGTGGLRNVPAKGYDTTRVTSIFADAFGRREKDEAPASPEPSGGQGPGAGGGMLS